MSEDRGTDSSSGPADAAPASGSEYGAGFSEPIRFGSSGSYGPQRTRPTSVLALVLGILGIAACPFVGIGGFLVGRKARHEIDADPRQWTGRGMATAGWILGIISMVYSALIVGVMILAFWIQFSR